MALRQRGMQFLTCKVSSRSLRSLCYHLYREAQSRGRSLRFQPLPLIFLQIGEGGRKEGKDRRNGSLRMKGFIIAPQGDLPSEKVAKTEAGYSISG